MQLMDWDGHKLIVVTGRSGAGKTRWCLRQAAHARSAGAHVAGLASPSIFADGARVAISLLALDTGECRCLARPRATGPHGGHCTSQWLLDPQALAWGEAVLAGVEGADLLVIDELGVLEFERGAGLLTGLRLVDQRSCSILVVVRPALLSRALQRWPWARVLDLGGVTLVPVPLGAEP